MSKKFREEILKIRDRFGGFVSPLPVEKKNAVDTRTRFVGNGYVRMWNPFDEEFIEIRLSDACQCRGWKRHIGCGFCPRAILLKEARKTRGEREK